MDGREASRCARAVRIAVAVLSITVALAGAAPSASADDWEDKEKRYIGTLGAATVNTGCGNVDAVGPSNIGGACFKIPSWAKRVSIFVEDRVYPVTASTVQFLDSDGQPRYLDWACGDRIYGATSSAYVRVAVMDPALSAVICDDPTMGATEGTIRARFFDTTT